MSVLERSLEAFAAQDGVSLLEHSRGSGMLVVFLRHLGCTFCREACADLRSQRGRIESSGRRIAVVGMVSDEDLARFLSRYGLGDVLRISDPAAELYEAFELKRGTVGQLFGLRVWMRGFVAGVCRGHWIGRLQGDGFRMPGAFLVRDGVIVRAYRHRTAADRPDYCDLGGAVTIEESRV